MSTGNQRTKSFLIQPRVSLIFSPNAQQLNAANLNETQWIDEFDDHFSCKGANVKVKQ